jgi:TDG/mug DNA glycosylase family protein
VRRWWCEGKRLPMSTGVLRDRVAPGLRVLFVGINPGLRSAALDHHFAGHSNRFWKLLYEARLVPEPVTFEDDDRLPGWGYGITNLVARPTAGLSDLSVDELRRGRRALVAKVRRLRPAVVALVGVTVYRALFHRPGRGGPRTQAPRRDVLGPAPETLAGVPVFVLPNPSGRNANYSYAEMLAAFTALARALRAIQN